MILNTAKNAEFFAQHIPHASYEVLLREANHFLFLEILSKSQCEQLGYSSAYGMPESVDRAALQDKVSQIAVEFFNSTLIKQK